MRYLILFLSFFISNSLWAQNGGVKKEIYPSAFKATVSANYYFPSGTYVYVESSGSYQEGDFYNRDFSPLRKLNTIDAGVGVQFQFSEKWLGGISQKLARSQVNGLSYTGFNIEHQGKIKSVDFLKLGALEYRKHINANVNDLALMSVLAGLHKSFLIKDRELGVLLSYRVFKIREIGGDEYSIFKKRFINKTVLRADVYFEAFKGIYIGLFALRDTNYFPYDDSLGSFDKYNSITPTYGISLSVVVNKKNKQSVLPGMVPLQIVDTFF